MTFVDERVKATTTPGSEERTLQQANRAIMEAVGVGSMFVERALEQIVLPRIGKGALASVLRPDFEHESLGIWDRLARAIEEGDYAVVIHLGAARAERMVREALRRRGEVTVSRDRNTGGLAEKSFGDLVRGSEESGRLSPALARYLRCTLTEEWGMNLRNRVAHGLITDEECDVLTAARIIHVLFVLRRFASHAGSESATLPASSSAANDVEPEA